MSVYLINHTPVGGSTALRGGTGRIMLPDLRGKKKKKKNPFLFAAVAIALSTMEPQRRRRMEVIQPC